MECPTECETCGKPLPEDAQFCPGCGTKAPAEAKKTQREKYNLYAPSFLVISVVFLRFSSMHLYTFAEGRHPQKRKHVLKVHLMEI